MNWYNSLTTPEKIYFYIAVIGTVLLVIQIIMMICSFGGGAEFSFRAVDEPCIFTEKDPYIVCFHTVHESHFLKAIRTDLPFR